MLAETRRSAPPGPAAFVLERMLEVPRSPRSPRSPRLAEGRKSTSSGTAGRDPTASRAARPAGVTRPVFDFVRTTTGGRPLSLPYSVDTMRSVYALPPPSPSLLDSLSLEPEQSPVASTAPSPTASPAPSLLDSPRLTPGSSLLDSSSLARLKQPVLLDSPCYQALPAIKRGVLWQQRERLWSRWKERYFVLTSDYLHCFKRRAAGDGLSQMGHFIFKVRLVDVDAVEWLNRRSYSVVALGVRDRPRVLLRAAPAAPASSPDGHGLEDWFELLEECTMASKQRRRALYERGHVGGHLDGHLDGHLHGHGDGDDHHQLSMHCVHNDWNASLQREGSLSPGLEVLLRRRLEEQEDHWKLQRRQPMLADVDSPSSSPSAPATFRSRGSSAPGPPPSRAPSRTPSRAPSRTPIGALGTTASLGGTHYAAPFHTAAGPGHHHPVHGYGYGHVHGLHGVVDGSSSTGSRRPVYPHRLNPDVFFMAADRRLDGDAYRDYHHTQV